LKETEVVAQESKRKVSTTSFWETAKRWKAFAPCTANRSRTSVWNDATHGIDN
jgi:hypothetical protein